MTSGVNLETEIENGPKRDRSITDCIFCLIMIGFWGCTIALMVVAFTTGNPNNLLQTYDYKSTPCGSTSNGTGNYSLTYFFQPFANFSSVVCVNQCPTWQANQTVPDTVGCYAPNLTYNLNISNCHSNSAINLLSSITNISLFTSQAFLIYNTTVLFNRFCIPSFSNTTASIASTFQNVTLATQTEFYFQQYLSDLINSWKYLLATIGIAVGLSILSLVFVRCCAGVLVCIILLLYLAAVFAGAALSGYEYNHLIAQIPASLQNTGNTDYSTARNYYILEIVLYVWGAISLIIILASIHSISVSIAVVKTSAMFVFSNFLIVFVPLLSAGFISGYVLLWIYVAVYLWSVGSVSQASNSPFATIIWNQSTEYLIIFHVFALLWNVAFLHYYGSFIISATCAIWYFNAGKSGSGFFSYPILTSAWWGVRYHLGSLAFGSFILAICWMIQVILLYIQKYIKKMKSGGVESAILNLFIRCLSCYVSCFTRFIEFVSELGFSYVAITSKNFCTSCGEAFRLLIANPLKFGLVSWVGSTFVFIGKIFVAALCGVIGYVMIKNDNTLSGLLYENVVPVAFFVLIGYVIGAIFFSVFGASINTVLLCFFVDKELSENNGRPASAPEPMREFYEKYKKTDKNHV